MTLQCTFLCWISVLMGLLLWKWECSLYCKLCQRPIDVVISLPIEGDEGHKLLSGVWEPSQKWLLMFSSEKVNWFPQMSLTVHFSVCVSSSRVVPASAPRAAEPEPLLLFLSWTTSGGGGGSVWWGQEQWVGNWTCRAWRMTRRSTSWKWSSGTWSYERRRRRGWGETAIPCRRFFFLSPVFSHIWHSWWFERRWWHSPVSRNDQI